MDPTCGGMKSFSASIESLPEISVSVVRSQAGFNPHLKGQSNTFKSEGNLLNARGDF